MNVSSAKQYSSFFDLTYILNQLKISNAEWAEEQFSDAFADDYERCDDCGNTGLNQCSCFDDDCSDCGCSFDCCECDNEDDEDD